jgi:hypothetical protein
MLAHSAPGPRPRPTPPRLVGFGGRIDAAPHEFKDARCLVTNVGALRELLHQLCLGGIHRRGGGADSLPGCGELSLGSLHDNAEGCRVDPVQQIATPDDLIVMHRDLDDLARDLRCGAHHEGTHAGIAGVGCQSIGNQRPAEQQDTEDENGQCPAPQWIGALGRRLRSRDLLWLSNLYVVHAEHPLAHDVSR